MPSRKLPRRAGRPAGLFLLLLLSVVLLIVVAAGVATLLSPVATNQSARTVLVTVPPGANARSIGALLERRGVVRHGMGFVLAARLEHVAGKMRAGHYELSPAMPPRQIALLIALGRTATDVVVIPEGFTLTQTARRLAQNHLVSESTFLALAQSQGRTFHVHGFQPPSDSLEGYLFPDTYQVPKNATAHDIITQMLANFHARALADNEAALTQFPGGLPAAVTLASLVEREAETDKDRPLIAAVLRNRLARGMRLQCDASIQYVLPQHKSRLFFADLRVNSPYNTYLHAGLPPGPICCPGRASLDAALHPASSDALFYVARPDGSHIFTRTLAEHDRAIAALRASGARN